MRAKAELERRKRRKAKIHAHSVDDWRADPVRFAHEALGINLWPRQEELLRAICAHQRVACRSGHKTGKSTTAAIAALWFAVCFPDARVVLLAPSGHQIRNIIWREVKRLYNRAIIPLGGVMSATPALGCKWPDGREIFGLSTDKAERAAGISGQNVLFIFDEASGIARDIFLAIEGNSASENARWVMFSNPTQQSGEFFDAFHKRRAFYGALVTISSAEASLWAERFPGLASKKYCAFMLSKYGPEAPEYQIRVLGLFAQSAANAIITIGRLQAARDRRKSASAKGPLCIGVDVARFGDDDSVLTAVRGSYAYPQERLHGADTQAVAAAVVQMLDRLTEPEEVPRVLVDTVGVGGGVADALRPLHRSGKIRLVEVNSSEKAEKEDEFANVRTEMHFHTQEWFDAGGTIEEDAEGLLHDDLLAPQYDIDPKGRRRVESKDDIKARIGRSPDHGDSLMLATYRRAASLGLRKQPANGNAHRFGANQRGY